MVWAGRVRATCCGLPSHLVLTAKDRAEKSMNRMPYSCTKGLYGGERVYVCVGSGGLGVGPSALTAAAEE